MEAVAIATYARLCNELTRDYPFMTEVGAQLYMPSMTASEASCVYDLIVVAHRTRLRLSNEKAEQEREQEQRRREFFASRGMRGR